LGCFENQSDFVMYRRSMFSWCLYPAIFDEQQKSQPPATKRITTTPAILRPMSYITIPYLSSNQSFLLMYNQAEREQALRDYKVTIEYKHLKSHAPGGVFIIPSIDNLRKFYGVIFVRRGPYMNGIFKFTLDLPMMYNDLNTHPTIRFTSRVYNPYVDPETGILDIQTTYPRWDPSRHYLVTVLTFVKKIFYAKTFQDAVANLEAKELAQTNPIAFTTNIHLCVSESNALLYTNDDNDSSLGSGSVDASTLQFTEETLQHRVLRDLLKETVKDPNSISKNLIVTLVERARNA
jgi:ubiquitin-protein ligase